MLDGNMKIEFVEGEICGVSVGAGLDETYKRIFESSYQEALKPSTSVDPAIEVIVFGCFWVEAVCNERLKELLHCAVEPDPVGKAVLKLVKRGSTLDKLELFASFSKANEPKSNRSIPSKLKRTFAVRNRLAHFKEEYETVDGAMQLDELLKRIPTYPEHELILELKPPRIQLHAEAVQEGIAWMDGIFEEYKKVERRVLGKEQTTQD